MATIKATKAENRYLDSASVDWNSYTSSIMQKDYLCVVQTLI